MSPARTEIERAKRSNRGQYLTGKRRTAARVGVTSVRVVFQPGNGRVGKANENRTEEKLNSLERSVLACLTTWFGDLNPREREREIGKRGRA